METPQNKQEFFELDSDDIENLFPSNPPFIEAIKELKAASDAFQKMVEIGVGSFHQYDRAWRDFLHAIDRVWNKIEGRCREEKKLDFLLSKYKKTRKSDDLLNYLIQARNSSEHSISPVIKEWDADLQASASKDGITLRWNKWDRPLLPVTNRGNTFPPPKTHLGNPLSFDKQHIESLLVAKLAMGFYVSVINALTEALLESS